jgi:hypothetical protein
VRRSFKPIPIEPLLPAVVATKSSLPQTASGRGRLGRTVLTRALRLHRADYRLPACAVHGATGVPGRPLRDAGFRAVDVGSGSISYSQGGRSNDRDMSTAVLRAGSANALRGHRQCRGPAVPTIPAGRSGTFMDGSPRSAGVAAACTHGDGRQLWQADDGVPPVQSALRNAINLSSGR